MKTLKKIHNKYHCFLKISQNYLSIRGKLVKILTSFIGPNYPYLLTSFLAFLKIKTNLLAILNVKQKFFGLFKSRILRYHTSSSFSLLTEGKFGISKRHDSACDQFEKH